MAKKKTHLNETIIGYYLICNMYMSKMLKVDDEQSQQNFLNKSPFDL